MSVIRLTIAAILMLCGTNAIAFGFVKDVPFEFPYIFELPGKSQAQIWEAARNHFASTYSDRRAVFSLEDQDQGLMIGKGVAPWRLAMNDCLTWYQIKFGAKDGRAKVQYIILEGVPPGSACTGWPRPNKKGYKKIREHIDTLAVELKSALEGNAAADEFMDF